MAIGLWFVQHNLEAFIRGHLMKQKVSPDVSVATSRLVSVAITTNTESDLTVITQPQTLPSAIFADSVNNGSDDGERSAELTTSPSGTRPDSSVQ